MRVWDGKKRRREWEGERKEEESKRAYWHEYVDVWDVSVADTLSWVRAKEETRKKPNQTSSPSI